MTSPGHVALVHDWLVHPGGAESVLRSFMRLFPEAPVFTAVCVPDPPLERMLDGREVRTSFLQGLPGVSGYYRTLLPLMPAAFGSLDLSGFDLVLSSSHAFSKAVHVDPSATHVCYCHTPPRYLWDLYDEYNPGVLGALRGPVLRWLRRVDRKASGGVDAFLANSHHVAARIERSYGRQAEVVYPPVDVDRFAPEHDIEPGDYFVAGGRLVPYKRIDTAVRAAALGSFPLKVFGDGPERRRLEGMAGPTVEFLGRVDDDHLADLLARCRALLFPGEEDFGILPVEAQAAGRPVVALSRGGARETVRDGRTGVLYDDDTPEGLADAVSRFAGPKWEAGPCLENAARFRRDRFEEAMTSALGL